MKKNIYIFIYFLICFYINVSILNNNLTQNSIIDLLFLNFNSFQKYNIDKLNIQLIINFLLLYILIMNILISKFDEESSFLKLIIYRKGTYSTIKDIILKNSFNMIIIIFIIDINIILQLFFYNILFCSILNFFVLNIYLLKFSIIMLYFITNQYINSINENFSKSLIKNYIYVILMILLDNIIGLNLITFSNNIYTELIYLIAYIIIFIVFIIVIIKKAKNGGINDRTR